MIFLSYQNDIVFIFSFNFFCLIFRNFSLLSNFSEILFIWCIIFDFFIFQIAYLIFFSYNIFLMLKDNILLVFLTHVLYNLSHNRLFNVDYHVFDVLNYFYFMIIQTILILFFCSFINNFLLCFVVSNIVDMSFFDIIFFHIILLL